MTSWAALINIYTSIPYGHFSQGILPWRSASTKPRCPCFGITQMSPYMTKHLTRYLPKSSVKCTSCLDGGSCWWGCSEPIWPFDVCKRITKPWHVHAEFCGWDWPHARHIPQEQGGRIPTHMYHRLKPIVTSNRLLKGHTPTIKFGHWKYHHTFTPFPPHTWHIVLVPVHVRVESSRVLKLHGMLTINETAHNFITPRTFGFGCKQQWVPKSPNPSIFLRLLATSHPYFGRWQGNKCANNK